MKLSCYCQHVLGVGHLHRSIEICRALADVFQVEMILGGPHVSLKVPEVRLTQLPGLKMDSSFSGLQPCEPSVSLDEIKSHRQRQLIEHIRSAAPAVLIIELYPFGRKQFRFELDPLLAMIKKEYPDILVYCSLRDILVEKTDAQEKFENHAVATYNRFFDGLLVHADPQIITIDETFAKGAQLGPPQFYTGFVTPFPSAQAAAKIRERTGASADQKLIVASIGSGSVGKKLLYSVAQAHKICANHRLVTQIFTGPYLSNNDYLQLKNMATDTLRVDRFTPDFINWLLAADLSISMAGYNTSMNVLAAQTPALMLPFSQNREQQMRLERLAPLSAISALSKEQLEPARLGALIRNRIHAERKKASVNLNGAANTRDYLLQQLK